MKTSNEKSKTEMKNENRSYRAKMAEIRAKYRQSKSK